MFILVVSSSSSTVTLSAFIPINIPFSFPNEVNGITLNLDIYSTSVSSKWNVLFTSPPIKSSRLFNILYGIGLVYCFGWS